MTARHRNKARSRQVRAAHAADYRRAYPPAAVVVLCATHRVEHCTTCGVGDRG